MHDLPGVGFGPQTFMGLELDPIMSAMASVERRAIGSGWQGAAQFQGMGRPPRLKRNLNRKHEGPNGAAVFKRRKQHRVRSAEC